MVAHRQGLSIGSLGMESILFFYKQQEYRFCNVFERNETYRMGNLRFEQLEERGNVEQLSFA